MPTRFSPAGACIYCGAAMYHPTSSRPLADEHIIPFGLNGDLILPESTCQACERMTGQFEAVVLRGSLLGCRSLLGLQTRRPKDRPKALPLFDTSFTPEKKYMIPIEDYPISLLLMQLDGPPILSGGTTNNRQIKVWSKVFRLDADKLARKYGITSFATPALDSFSFIRTIAKIGYSFAVAHLGIGAFRPLLTDLIFGRENPHSTPFVGGIFDDVHSSSNLHDISINIMSIASIKYVVVHVRLFSHWGTPVYVVVVGESPNQLIWKMRPVVTNA